MKNGLKYLKQLVIRQGSEFHEPALVYIKGYSEVMEDVACEIVNTGATCFGGYFEPYDSKRLEELTLIWKIENNERERVWLDIQLEALV